MQCLLAGFIYGFFNYAFGMIGYLHLRGAFMFLLGPIFVCTPYYVYKLVYYLRNKDKPDYKPQFGYLNMGAIFGLSMRTLVSYVNINMKLIVYGLCQGAGMNPGISSAIFSSSIIFTSILCYFLYKEKLTIRVVLGIFLMFACAILISASKHADQDPDSETSVSLGQMISIVVLSFLIALTISAQALLAKHVTYKYKYPPLE